MDHGSIHYGGNGYRGCIPGNSHYHNNRPVRSSGKSRIKKKEPMKYHQQARDYITRLINLQIHMPDRYKRIDRTAVSKSILILENYLSAYTYDTDQKMRTFWAKHRYEIKILLPSRQHSAFEKLLIEFEHLDDFASQDPELAIWQPIVQALSKF